MPTSPATDHLRLPKWLPGALREELELPQRRKDVIRLLDNKDNPIYRLVHDWQMEKVWRDLGKLPAAKAAKAAGEYDRLVCVLFWGAVEAVTMPFDSFRARERQACVLRKQLVTAANHLAELLDKTDKIGRRPYELQSLYLLMQAAAKQTGRDTWKPGGSHVDWGLSAPTITDCIRMIAVKAPHLEVSYVNEVIRAAIASRKSNTVYQALRYLWAHLRDNGGLPKSDALGQIMGTAIAVALGDSGTKGMPDASAMRKLMRPRNRG